MTPVTVLGLGPMGHALAAAFITAGHPTTVWNRTPSRGRDLDAVIADSAAAAIGASPLVVACLRDYDVVASVLDASALEHRTLLNVTGGSPARARAMAAWAAEHGIAYLDGVIMSTPDAIGTDQVAVFYSGSETAYETHRDTLAALGPASEFMGADAGRAAAIDVALQDMLWTSMTGVAHMFALAAAEGITSQSVSAHAKGLIGFFPDMIDMLDEQLRSGVFAGEAGSVDSAANVMDNILDAVRANGLDDSVLAAAREQVQRAVDAGYGSEGFGRLATLP